MDISRNYEGDGWLENFPHQSIGLAWPEEIEESIQESTNSIINNGCKVSEKINKPREPKITYTPSGPVANRISILLSDGTIIQLGMLKFSGISQNTNGTFQKYKYYVESKVLGNFMYIGRTYDEVDSEITKMIENKVSDLYPDDFPKQKDQETEVTTISGEIDGVSYKISKIDITNNIRVEFTYNGIKYVLTDIKGEQILKQNYYFVYPEGADRATQNLFRKRIGATGKSQEEKIRKMLKNISRVIKGNKDKDRKILYYLEECKEKDPIDETIQLVREKFGEQTLNTSITEISDLLPEDFSIELGDVDQENISRSVTIHGFEYKVWQESIIGGGTQVHVQPVFKNIGSLQVPDEIQYANSSNDTLQTLDNRAQAKKAKAGTILRVKITDTEKLKDGIKDIFLDFNSLAIGQNAELISDNSTLRRNYGFMTWYILNYNKSLETSSQS